MGMSENGLNPAIRDMITQLIGFDTTSRYSNLALISDVEAYLGRHGVSSQLIHNQKGTKANLYATIGPEVDGGIVLSGHTDVVPVDGQDWHSDPFQVREADGCLYGRGTADMKSFCAIALALVPRMLESRLKAPIHLAFSYDEEVGCLGVGGLIQHMRTLPVRPKAAIVGEPTDMTVVNAHKGCASFVTDIQGFEAHSSATHHGVNAVMAAAELIHHLSDIAERVKERAPADSRFDPPYTTVHVGTFRGGTAQNIIPKDARFTWEYRAINGEDGTWVRAEFDRYVETVLRPRLKAGHDSADIQTRTTAAVPPLVPDSRSTAEALVLALANSNQTFAASYCTEAGLFQQADVPTVICGPGNIAQAHKPDEFITIEQINACEAFLNRLIDHLAA